MEGVALSRRQREEITRQQLADMEERYAELVGARRLESQLLVSRGGGGEIVGCVGCELAVVHYAAAAVLPRRKGEAIFKEALGEVGARERNLLRKMPLAQLAASVLPAGHIVCPVLSNLAVASAARRTGLARVLCEACEAAALEWGFGAIMLQVEEENTPARGLYTKLGYVEMWRVRDAPATRVEVDPDGGGCRLQTTSTTLIAMCKPLSGDSLQSALGLA